MKIQYLAIIFLIIIIPMTLVLTMYNQAQINNLNSQLVYKTYLSDATHNAIKAFELNTVNNKYSQVADSLKRDVEASVNVFLTSMAKSLGTSGATPESVSEYVPAVLFTLYDGYYIYSPTYSEELKETENVKEMNKDNELVNVTITESQNPPVEKFSHILKPYVYYTMRYVKGNENSSNYYDFVVNYSLDNYITIYGTVKEKYVTKSGYLLQIDGENKLGNGISIDVDQEKLSAVLKKKILYYILSPSEYKSDAMKTVNDINNNDIKGIYNKYSDDMETYIKGNNDKDENAYYTSLKSDMGEKIINSILENPNRDINWRNLPVSKIDQKLIGYDAINGINSVLDCFTVEYKPSDGSLGIAIEDPDAKAYYVKALQFSLWVNENLGDITPEDAKDNIIIEGGKPSEVYERKSDGSHEKVKVFEGKTDKIFNTKKGSNNNPEVLEDPFSQHKNEVIRYSIQLNLESSIARYNQNFFGLKHGYDLKMPVLDSLDWEAITNKVTMVTFMQGMIVGNKVFNDYSVVSSDKNKQLIDVNEIYYFNTKASGSAEYHRLYCPRLLDVSNGVDRGSIKGYKAIEYDVYKSKDNNGDIKYEFGEEINGYRSNLTGGLTACYECIVGGNYTPDNLTNRYNLLFAQYEAIGRERNKHYKVNSYMDSVYEKGK